MVTQKLMVKHYNSQFHDGTSDEYHIPDVLAQRQNHGTFDSKFEYVEDNVEDEKEIKTDEESKDSGDGDKDNGDCNKLKIKIVKADSTESRWWDNSYVKMTVNGIMHSTKEYTGTRANWGQTFTFENVAINDLITLELFNQGTLNGTGQKIMLTDILKEIDGENSDNHTRLLFDGFSEQYVP